MGGLSIVRSGVKVGGGGSVDRPGLEVQLWH